MASANAACVAYDVVALPIAYGAESENMAGVGGGIENGIKTAKSVKIGSCMT